MMCVREKAVWYNKWTTLFNLYNIVFSEPVVEGDTDGRMRVDSWWSK